MVCVGCKKIKTGCSKGCLDYLLESLSQPKEMKIRGSKNGESFASKHKRNHTYIGGR